MRRRIALVLLSLAAFSLRAEEMHLTKQSLDPRLLTYLVENVDIPDEVRLHGPAFAEAPVVGIVSHHSLVAPVHHRWFKVLSERRTVETFIIIAPRHFQQGTESVSISTRPWNAGNGTLAVDGPLASDFLSALNVPEDHSAFRFEHGIGALLPFIVEYFPGSQIVPVLIDPKAWSPAKVQVLATRISRSLLSALGTMLIISVDFSHAAGVSVTKARDAESRLYIEKPSTASFLASWSDNRPGLYCLGIVAEQLSLATGHILCYTTSYEYTGRNPENITSYFFAFYTR